mmetsp:Transcript_9553/g.32570  ORF Transcript_9553/g.32570 Transcript_9553/m.32570 type:complete len:734 (+) Transcript_9553:62-2263(+)
MSRRNLVIKPFRQQHSMDAQRAREVWGDLHNAIGEIYRKNASRLSFEELYRNAYNLVLHKHGDLLYDGVAQTISEHLEQEAVLVSSKPNEALLAEVRRAWDEHKTSMGMVKDILMYMDRTHVVQREKTPVYSLGLQLFRSVVAYHPHVRDRLKSILLEDIQRERQGELIDRALVRDVLSMLVDLGIDGTSVYEEEFEAGFLEASRNFYRRESVDFLSHNTCPDYMRKAEARLAEEQERVDRYLSPTSEAKLKQVVEHELITAHARTLVEMEGSGCASMMGEHKVEDLGRMYALFSRVPSTLDILRECMYGFVRHAGEEIVASQDHDKDPVTFVQEVLDLKAKFDEVVASSFRGEKRFQKKLKEAFEDFINRDTRAAAYLASYLDELLRARLRGLTEQDVDQQLERAVVIFRHLQDKDIFENFYKQHLSRRLLAGRSISDDAEKNMIAKLKAECGYQFTSKLEGMFTDMRISKDTMDDYRTSPAYSQAPVELEVNVLTMGYWPSQAPAVGCRLPAVITECCESFSKFYLERHNGRKLTWQTSMGTADLKATFATGRKELNVSTYQMCILLLFNEADTLSLEHIRGATLIPDAELRRHLLSLCTPKHRVLIKGSRGKGIADGDSFTFNAEFSSKLRRVKVPLISAKETIVQQDGGSAALPGPVEEDRRHLVEAAIVRIMKARKRMSHNDLVAEVTRQLSFRFVAPPPFVRRRLESLIERDYIRRSEVRTTYEYVA